METYLYSAMRNLKDKKKGKRNENKSKGFFNARKQKNIRQVLDCEVGCNKNEALLSSYLQECPDC